MLLRVGYAQQVACGKMPPAGTVWNDSMVEPDALTSVCMLTIAHMVTSTDSTMVTCTEGDLQGRSTSEHQRRSTTTKV